MTTPNPIEGTSDATASVSRRTFCIAGIELTIHGLSEVPAGVTQVAVLWLLHPRLCSEEDMHGIATQAIHAWNARLAGAAPAAPPLGLVAASFDQRNHGRRLVSARANDAWRQGNPSHAPDMFGVFAGTADDCAQLLAYLPAYLPAPLAVAPAAHLVLGVSLGGHAAWHVLLRDARVRAAVVVIGCPDYAALMRQRAEKSRRDSWTRSTVPGAAFVGSEDFPMALHEEIARRDPAALFMDADTGRRREGAEAPLKEAFRGKRILNLSGGADKLVPYQCGKAFLDFMSRELAEGGALSNEGVVMEDLVFEGVGHKFTPSMADKAVEFLCESMEMLSSQSSEGSKSPKQGRASFRSSKI